MSSERSAESVCSLWGIGLVVFFFVTLNGAFLPLNRPSPTWLLFLESFLLSELSNWLDSSSWGFPGPLDLSKYSEANRFFWTLPCVISLFCSRLVPLDSSLNVSLPDEELGCLCSVVPSITVEGNDSWSASIIRLPRPLWVSFFMICVTFLLKAKFEFWGLLLPSPLLVAGLLDPLSCKFMWALRCKYTTIPVYFTFYY